MCHTAKSLQSCPTLCDLIDGSPPGCPIPGILQARTLEWVAISFSNAWKWDVKVKSLSRVCPSATLWTAAYQAPQSMDIKNYIVFLKNWPFYHYMIPLFIPDNFLHVKVTSSSPSSTHRLLTEFFLHLWFSVVLKWYAKMSFFGITLPGVLWTS